jgi:hypothetical protein
MVGVIQRDEAFRVFGGREYEACIVDTDGCVARRMEDDERAPEAGDALLHVLCAHVVDEILANPEFPSRQLHARLTVALDLVDVAGKALQHMSRIERRADRCHRLCLGDLAGRGEDCGTAQTVSDEKRRCLMLLAQPVGGLDEVLDIGAEVGVGELAFAGAQPGEIEAQRGDAELAQTLAMRDAAKTSLEQVKQWANSATARGFPPGNQGVRQERGPDCR